MPNSAAFLLTAGAISPESNCDSSTIGPCSARRRTSFNRPLCRMGLASAWIVYKPGTCDRLSPRQAARSRNADRVWRGGPCSGPPRPRWLAASVGLRLAVCHNLWHPRLKLAARGIRSAAGHPSPFHAGPAQRGAVLHCLHGAIPVGIGADLPREGPRHRSAADDDGKPVFVAEPFSKLDDLTHVLHR